MAVEQIAPPNVLRPSKEASIEDVRYYNQDVRLADPGVDQLEASPWRIRNANSLDVILIFERIP